jgi:hypothetical protein
MISVVDIYRPRSIHDCDVDWDYVVKLIELTKPPQEIVRVGMSFNGEDLTVGSDSPGESESVLPTTSSDINNYIV